MLRSIYAAFALISLMLSWSGATLAGTAAGPRPMLSLVRLVDQKGGTFNQKGLLERPSVVHFGFTNCPAICPTTLSEMSSRMEELGAVADEINFIFVTVDPERDTPAVLGNYLSAFDPRIIGLTGEVAEIKALADSLGVAFARNPLDGGDYTMDHAVHAVLLDATGRKTGVLYMGGDSRVAHVIAALKRLAANSRAPSTASEKN